jgi:hypothetical protein
MSNGNPPAENQQMAQASRISGEFCPFQQNLVVPFFPHAALMCGQNKATRRLKVLYVIW